MNNPFDYKPDKACLEAYDELLARIERLRDSDNMADKLFCRELDGGKMLGVLVATNDAGERHLLYAFSGQLGCGGFYFPGFVGPVFDYLAPDGYFKQKEREISCQNREIGRYESSVLADARREYEEARGRLEAEVEGYRLLCRRAKQERHERRESGLADDAELTDMIRRSQFEKAELRRLKKKMQIALEPYESGLRDAETHLEAMKNKRRSDSEALQHWLFSNFRVSNFQGEYRSLLEIFADRGIGIPPSGAGECCAPKLLHAAYRQGWRPESIAEFWYGKPKSGEVRIHGTHYPACRGKCLPVLNWMLQGLEVYPPLDSIGRERDHEEPVIVYENQWFCVVEKPSGMLSVPGKGPDVSLEQWLAGRYGPSKAVKMAHRLDQDTSGLVVATFGDDSYRLMQSLFAARRVRKVYAASLEGDYEAKGIARKGIIDLPLSLDWLDRPRQCVDLENGKESVTEYEFQDVADGKSRILFYPKTGRTHQLRVHSACAAGLGMPIAGDRLYGRNNGESAERLHLHARKLEFTFPLDGEKYSFESPEPF